MKKKTKIVATIGPASESEGKLAALFAAGVDIIRVNFSHGDYDEHGAKIDRWNKLLEQEGGSGAVMADLSGPEVRTGDLPETPFVLAAGDELTLVTEEGDAEGNVLSINYAGLPGDVAVGETVLLDDGAIACEVEETTDTEILAKVTRGGSLTSGGRGVNVPDSQLSLPALTEKDRADLEFALSKEIDFVAVSFVKTADDITQVQEFLKEHDREDVKVIAKIETRSAVDNIRDIVTATDGVMVARGDLAVEVKLENVPRIQKEIITLANAAGKPVITATQMLESMTESSAPTRAETSDVANAILDGSDAVMLSGETAMGEYPVEAVSVMARIARITETDQPVDREEIRKSHRSPVDAVTASVVSVAEDIGARAIVALTDSGFTARMIARYRPTQNILAFSAFERTCRQLALSYGVQPAFLAEANDTDAAIAKVKKLLVARDDFSVGDKVIIAAGMSASAEHLGTNALLIAEL